MARRVSSPQTVGRADTLAALDGALAQASEGAPRLVLLAGEAGIGKTRLARELAQRARAQGHRVLWGECVPLQAGELPYAPIVAALRNVGPERGELDRLLAELREGRGPETATPQAPARLFELLLRALGRLADEAPTVFVVEDVHWADAATQDALRFLARNLREERLLLVVTLRTDEPHLAPPLRGLLAELARSAHGERLDLARLTAEETALQVAGIVETPGVVELAEWVHARAEGNPYFAEELLAARVAGEGDAVLPESLREVLLARAASLDRPARQVLHVAATAGRDIGHELLVRAAGLDGDELGGALQQLERALELLPPDASPERAAAMGLIGKHLVYGELPSETREFALEALEVARSAGARAEEGIVNTTLGIAFAYGGDPDTGIAHYREAIRIAREVGRGERLAVAINNLGDALLMLGRLDEALATLEAGFEEVRDIGLALSDGMVIQATMAECELRLGRWKEAAARLERLLEGAHDDEMRLVLTAFLGALRAREGSFDVAAELDREAAALLTANVGPGSIVNANTARAELALLRGDPEAACAIVRETRDAIAWGGIVCYPSMLLAGVQAEADLAERARATGRDDEVERARRAAEELFGSTEIGGSLRAYRFEHPVGDLAPPETRAVWAQGEAELTRLNGVSRGELWAQVAAQWDRLRFPYPAAYARLREAEARLAAGGDRAAAAVALRAAHAALTRLGAVPLRDEAEALARRARIDVAQRPEERPAERPFDLTARELTVLERVAAGQTNRQIADDLYLSTRTVDMHVRNILGKLNAANRVEAAATAHRLGLARDTAVLP